MHFCDFYFQITQRISCGVDFKRMIGIMRCQRFSSGLAMGVRFRSFFTSQRLKREGKLARCKRPGVVMKSSGLSGCASKTGPSPFIAGSRLYERCCVFSNYC